MKSILTATLVISACTACAQQQMKPEETEVWQPVKIIAPPKSCDVTPPADAVILFDGKNLSQWVSTKDTTMPAQWTVANGVVTVKKGTGNIQTKQTFNDYQLHLEFRIPKNITGKGQARGNSGLFLASIGRGDAGYELQVLDSYNNETYANGQVGSIYKQLVPLANPMRRPGDWNVYDIAWTAPRFNGDGSVKSPARVTVYLNSVLVQNNVELKGPTVYIGHPTYKTPHGPSPIKLQDHGDPSEPISFRNIWIRPL